MAAGQILDVNMWLLLGLGFPVAIAFCFLGWLWAHFIVGTPPSPLCLPSMSL